MHEVSFLSAVMGLIFVLGLILLLSWLLKRFGSPILSGRLEQKKQRISLLEAEKQTDSVPLRRQGISAGDGGNEYAD